MRVNPTVLIAAGLALLVGRRALRAPYDLTDRRVLITGGSRGLGLALAGELLARGARVTLLARDAAELARAAAQLDAPGRVHTVVADVTDADAVARAVEEAARVMGGLDVLVNNAGLIQTGPLDHMTEADFRAVMDVNAFAPLRVTQLALPHLRRSRGRVLIVSSVGGKVAVPHLAPYSVSKFAVAGLGQALRSELARDGVGVTTVLPGLMRTGSPRHALVKGQQEREYALFATLDTLPVLSLDAREAARRIVQALVRGDAEAMIGGPAVVLRYAQALAPQLTAEVLALGTRALPGNAATHASARGADVESAVTRANPVKRRAERDLNQLGPDGPAPTGS